MDARLFISPHCFLCRFIEPPTRAIAAILGIRLSVFKLGTDGVARQVNGSLELDGRGIPAVPTLTIGQVAFVGVPAPLARLIGWAKALTSKERTVSENASPEEQRER